VGQAANTAQGFSIETIDTSAPGNYTYALNVVQSNGVTSWGASGNTINAVELRGTQGPTGPNPDGVGPMNYTQTTSPTVLSNVPVVSSAAAASTIVSAPLQTLGNPVRVAAMGDVIPGMGGSLIVQFYRYSGSLPSVISTAIGSPYTLVAGAANQSQGFSLETIDSNTSPGAYTYALNLIQSNGTTTWGAYSGAVLNAVELRGAKGPTGSAAPNLLLSNNVFSGTNVFTNTVTISSLTASTTGNLNLATTNVSTQNTQIVQTATSNPTTSYTTVQALHSNTAGAGITYNTLALNPSGGNVGVGISTPQTTLHVFNTTADASAAPDGGSNIGQLLLRNSKTGSTPYSMTVGVDQATGVGYLNAAGNGAYQSVCLQTRGGFVGIGLTNPTYQLQLSSDSAAKPTTSTWTVSSDQRLKQDIVIADTQRCMEIIKSVPLKRYTWRPEVYTEAQVKDRSKLGWIAQDVEQVFPKAVGQQRFVYDQQWSTTATGERQLVSEQVLEDCRDLNVDQMYAVMYGAISRLIEEKELLQGEVAALRTWAQSQGFTGAP
jgi:hypothetical protein